MTRYRHHPTAVTTPLGEQVVALQLETRRYFTLNETAACAWQALEGGADEDALVRAFVETTDISSEEARPHVRRLLDRLLDLRLIEACPAGSR